MNKSDIRIGILSDVHLGFLGHINPNYYGYGQEPFGDHDLWFKNALKYFKKRGVDVIVIPGDMANACAYNDKEHPHEYYAEIENKRTGEIFREVFKGTRTKLFCIYGNHDLECLKQEKLLGGDKTIFQDSYGEPFKKVARKKVKGYTFIGGHWGLEKLCKNAVKKECLKNPNKPVIYVQHPCIKNTTHDIYKNLHNPHVWDDGLDNVKDFTNVIALSGHTHAPITDERNIWQSKSEKDAKCTVISCGTLNYADSVGDLVRGENLLTKQGLYMTIKGNEVNVERLSFYTPNMLALAKGETDKINYSKCVKSCGKDWHFVVGGEKVYDLSTRKEKAVAPEFEKGAELGLGRSEKSVIVHFPKAKPLDCDDNILHSYYAVAIDELTGEVVSTGQVATEHHVDHTSDYFTPYYQILIEDLKPDTSYIFKVYARDCFQNLSKNPLVKKVKTLKEKRSRLY
ncbi:MAG: metallophosphoesterase [Clostridia bacterium]|nr:metallophosphoesterase [Clostridia bacterium]